MRDEKCLLARIIFRMEGGTNDDELVARDCLKPLCYYILLIEITLRLGFVFRATPVALLIFLFTYPLSMCCNRFLDFPTITNDGEVPGDDHIEP
jgi:hypothetical protein